MNLRLGLLLLTLWAIGAAHATAAPRAIAAPQATTAPPEHISHGHFRDVALYRPAGPVHGFVLLLSGDTGFTTVLDQAARALANEGAMVAGVDTAQLRSALAKDGSACVFPDGDLENLSRYLQGYARVPAYLPPIVVGEGAGGALAYALLAKSTPDIFPAAISLDFCPRLDLGKRACTGGNLRFGARTENDSAQLLLPASLRAPWVVLQGGVPPACAGVAIREFVAHAPGGAIVDAPALRGAQAALPARLPKLLAAYRSLASVTRTATPAPPASLADLPLVVVPAVGSGDSFAILLSGDGGWASLDKQVAGVLAKHGVTVIGFDSLRYFWQRRTPAGLASDLDRVIRYYAAHLHKAKVRLIGYSQGADVLPFAINRLSPDTRGMVMQSVLIGLGNNASFEFHLSNWMSNDDAGGLPILPEASRLRAADTLCLYGSDETESLCPKIPPGHVSARVLPGGHHFDGAYERLADIVLAPAGRVQAPAVQPDAGR